MVHRVVKEVDKGVPIIVREVEFKEGEGIEEFEASLHSDEDEIIMEGVKMALEEAH
jgi:phosphoribosylglycinamide formyltransferase